MKTINYWKLMKETSDKISPLLEQALKDLNPSQDIWISTLPKNRIEKACKTRANIARFTYEACRKSEGKDIREEDWIPLAAASETLLWKMYFFNQVWDKKGGCVTKDRIDKNIIAGSITGNLAIQILNGGYQGTEIWKKAGEKLEQLLLVADRVFMQGQYEALFECQYEQSKHLSFKDMISLCDKRVYGINVSFYEKIAEMATILSEIKEGRRKEAIIGFGRDYGEVIQRVNDILDFVPPESNPGTSEKLPRDAYADIKHGELTYPIIYTLHKGSDEDKRYMIKMLLKGESATDGELKELTIRLMNDGAINFAKRDVIKYVSHAKKLLRENFDKETRRALSTMISTLGRSNRYYLLLDGYKLTDTKRD